MPSGLLRRHLSALTPRVFGLCVLAIKRPRRSVACRITNYVTQRLNRTRKWISVIMLRHPSLDWVVPDVRGDICKVFFPANHVVVEAGLPERLARDLLDLKARQLLEALCEFF